MPHTSQRKNPASRSCRAERPHVRDRLASPLEEMPALPALFRRSVFANRTKVAGGRVRRKVHPPKKRRLAREQLLRSPSTVCANGWLPPAAGPLREDKCQ